MEFGNAMQTLKSYAKWIVLMNAKTGISLLRGKKKKNGENVTGQ